MTKKLLLTAAVAFIPVLAASEAMPSAQQNAMVGKYCAVCHSDAHPNGGLSLEHFDAANADPALAAMLASKLKGKALGASGQPLPDRATQDALLDALSAEAAGSGEWVVKIQAPILTASIVEQVPSSAKDNAGEPDLYRLTVTCNTGTREAEMQLAWSPGVPQQGRAMLTAVDGKALFTYKVEGIEKNGNGMGGTSGPGAAILYSTKAVSGVPKAMPLPSKMLTIRNLFADETVVFPFGALAQPVRHELSGCFTAKNTRE